MRTDIDLLQSVMNDDIDAVQEWCNEMYDQSFASYFEETRKLYERMRSNSRIITDDELSDILTLTPLNLFSVSEELNRFRLNYEVIKLKVKENEIDRKYLDSNKSEHNVAYKLSSSEVEDKLILTAYNAVITRVENEISFSRELIMAAKKLWDRRKQTEDANPIGASVGKQLPAYPDPHSTGSQTYIK